MTKNVWVSNIGLRLVCCKGLKTLQRILLVKCASSRNPFGIGSRCSFWLKSEPSLVMTFYGTSKK